MRSSFNVLCALAFSTLLLAGCGSQPGIKAAPSNAPTITSQPAPQSTPLGQTAIFSVLASGTLPFRYQWSRNGSPIAGATQSTYVTPPVTAGDSGETFTVSVTNSVGAANSNAASLTVGPRSPMAGDLRFNQVDAPTTADGPDVGGGIARNFLPFENVSYTNHIGFPLQLGPGICYPGSQYDCSWELLVSGLPANVSGLSVTYRSDMLSNLAADLSADSPSNAVINCLDEEAANDIFALESTSTTQATGFTMTRSSVSLNALQGLATQLGLQSQVITALSWNASGKLDVLSYSWKSDPSTPYDVLAVPVTMDTVKAQAQTLADEGYIITAFGGNSSSGYVLVGTKVQGDSIPRPLVVAGSLLAPGKGFAPVAMPVDYTHNPIEYLWIFEK